jgi:tripartite-type tricarboxylate transporter receptor subunit TctC
MMYFCNYGKVPANPSGLVPDNDCVIQQVDVADRHRVCNFSATSFAGSTGDHEREALVTINSRRSAAVLAGLFVCSAGALVPEPAAADPVADFYKGRTVSIVIGSGMGGSYGLYSQLAARYIGKKIPGSPTVIVQSMPGAGGMKALNYTYNAALKDGSVISLVHQEVLQETILNEQAKFDARKYNWIGRFVDVDYIGVASDKSGVKSLDDVRKREVAAGATGMRAASGLAPEVFNRAAGTKFKVVAGYKGVADMFLAQEKGELDLVTATWVIVKAEHAAKVTSGKLVPIFAMSLERIPELPNVPAITEFGRNPAEQTFLRIWTAGGTIGRSLAAPPGVPADRVAAFRAAFDAMLKDDAFKADVEKRKTPFNALSGTELASRIDKVMQLTPQQVADTRKVYADLLASIKDK